MCIGLMASVTGRHGGRKGNDQDVMYVKITMIKKEISKHTRNIIKNKLKISRPKHGNKSII